MPTYSAIIDAEIAPEAPVTTSLMTRLRDNALTYLGAPSGTVSLFRQTAAPLGWTKGSTHNDKGLRLVTGSVGTSGSVAYSTVFARTATDNFTITTANLPASNTGDDTPDHNHPVTVHSDSITFGNAGGLLTVTIFNPGSGTTFNTGGASARHQHPRGGSGTALAAGMDMRVSTVDVIEATKD